MSEAQLRIEISAVADQARSEIEALKSQINELNKTTRNIALGEQMQRVGGQISNVGQAVVGTVGGMGMSIVQTAGNFEASLNNVRAVTGATGQDFAALRDQAKKLGATTQFSASEAADGMAFLGMAGYNTTEIISAMPAALNLAAAGGLDLAKSADIASNVMGGFQLQAGDTQRIADVLAQTARRANTDIGQLGEAFGYAAPVAQSFGMEIEEASAILGKFGDIGIQGSRAGTTLAGSLGRLLKPVPAAQSALDELGISTKNTDGTFRGFTDILQDFADTGASAGDILTVFGEEAGRGVLSLVEGIRAGNVDLQGFTSELQTSTGAAQEMADIKMEGYEGGVKALQSAFEGLQIAIADAGILDFATSIVQGLAKFTQGLTQLNPWILRVGVAIGALVLAAGALLIPLGMVMSVVGTIIAAGGVGVIIAGISAAFAGLLAALAPLGAVLLGVVAPLAGIALLVVGAIAGFAALAMLVGAVISAFQEFGLVGTLVLIAQTAIQLAVQGITMAITGLAAIVLGTVGAIVGVFVAIGSAAVSGAAMVISGMLRIVGAIAGMVAKVLGIPPIFSSALSAAAGVVQGFAGSFMAAGVGLISALVEGIKSKVGEIKAAVEEALSAARALLPFSDAKEGPFRDLTYSGGQLMATIAKGVLGNAEAVPSAMSQVFIPAMGMTPPTPMNAQAAAGGTTTNNSSNSPITVNFQLSSGGDGQGIMAQIRANQGEIVRIIESATARRDRTRYSNA